MVLIINQRRLSMPPRYKNPYDFIPLEEKPVRAEIRERTQEAIKASLYTGWMACTLQMETPLFIHGEGQQRQTQRRFAQRAGQPYIPASAIKGLIRSVYEIVTNSCVSVVPEDLKYYKKLHPVLDLCPLLGPYEPCKNNAEPCSACALFGMVERGADDASKALARAGRVYISDTDPEKNKCRECWVDFPQIGGGPHPWHMPFYFELDRRGQRQKLLGRKLYYHHRNYDETIKRALQRADESMKLECFEGQFTFEVRFHNLRCEELQALVYAIELDQSWPALRDSHGAEIVYALRHHFGFGKPLGLGSVAIHIDSLQVIEAEGNGPARYLRYELNSDVWKVLHPPQGDAASPLPGWKQKVIEAWGVRSPRGKESLIT
jgi:hypothetical protein